MKFDYNVLKFVFKMIIIIPLGGLGQRFKDFGYTDPKPLIKVNGNEIIKKVINSLKLKHTKDKLYIVYNSELEKFNIRSILSKYKYLYPIKCNFITAGPVETVKELVKSLSQKNQDENLAFIDGDTFYNFDILSKIRNFKKDTIIYSKTNLTEPIYSYLNIKNNYVTEIKEKIKISENFSVGCYYFRSIFSYLKYSDQALKKNKSANFSHVYSKILNDGIKVKGFKINQSDFDCLGTPKQLQNFAKKAKQDKKKFCFELENTLVKDFNKNSNIKNVKPIEENIKFLNFLIKKKHEVIIYTSTPKNNIYEYKKKIKEILKKLKISYNKILFTKPDADFFIGNSSVNSLENLPFKLGFYDIQDNSTRYFNNIIVGENFTVKQSDELKLNHEIKYLKKLPKALKKYFPRLISNGINWYKMETIKGVPLSYLYLNNIFETRHLDMIFKNINQIHNFKKLNNNPKSLYLNYKNKFEARLKKIDKNLIQLNNDLILILINFLKDYENSKLGKMTIIHGDPVFSNILLSNGKDLIFIDPRGEQDGKFSIFGDFFYDYAKILQGLYGYDQILSKAKPIINRDLITYFESKFSKIDNYRIKMICASLYVSLIPLHDNRFAGLFFEAASNIFNDANNT